jgi:uncharacterized phage infection (PIP) family protein YhgE
MATKWSRRTTAVAAGVLLVASACQMPSSDTSYRLQGDPWSARPADSAANGGGASGSNGATDGAKSSESATTASARERPKGGEPTVLEQLQESRDRITALEAECKKSATEVASLTALVDQLRKENASLAQLSDQSTQARTATEQEMEKLRQQTKEVETRCRTLADDLLAERIQRVRVERELILAKVEQSEKSDGN